MVYEFDGTKHGKLRDMQAARRAKYLDLVRGGYGYAALTRSALHNHDADAHLAVTPIESPHVPITLCLAQSAKRKATPLVRRTSEVLRELSLQV